LSNDILAKRAVTVIAIIVFALLLIFGHKDLPEGLQGFPNQPDILTSHRLPRSPHT
jgi:hypothetical protein